MSLKDSQDAVVVANIKLTLTGHIREKRKHVNAGTGRFHTEELMNVLTEDMSMIEFFLSID